MFWLASFVAVLALNGAQDDTSLLAKLVPIPTGRNGYEDYLRAGDMIGSNNWVVYDQWIAYKRSHSVLTQTEVDGDSEVPDLPPGVSPEMSELAVRKVANERFGSAFEVVKMGNAKQVWDPRTDLDSLSVFPEMGRFKTLAKIGMNKAHVEFSEGRTTQAIDDLFAGILFSKEIFDSSLISSLVGIAIQTIMLAEFNEHLGQLSLSDAETIDRKSCAFIAERLSIANIFKREAAMTIGSLDAMIDSPDGTLSEDEVKLYGHALKDLTPADRASMKNMLTQTLQLRYNEYQERFSGDEGNWILRSDARDPVPSPQDMSYSNLALVVANDLAGKSSMSQFAEAMAKSRIQIRLLQLHAKILEYHWKNNVWPRKIEDFADTKTAYDPFAKAPFHYELKENGYRLYSLGIPSIGPLELKYRKVPQNQITSGANP